MLIKVSNGCLADKLTIASLKIRYIKEGKKLKSAKSEYIGLSEKYKTIGSVAGMKHLYNQLFDCNNTLWIVNEKIREYEANGCYDDAFIGLARELYKKNDLRSHIRSKINSLSCSEIIEVKSFKK